MKDKKILVILGPTATGKTDLALNFAKKFNGELISCDSRQIYTGLDLGTGKEASRKLKVKRQKGFWEIDGIKIWMYDVVNPETRFSVYEYVRISQKVIEEIISRGKLPIIVGGTGLYLKGLLEGFGNLNSKIDRKLRGELEKLSKDDLQKKLTLLSPIIFNNLNNSEKNNPRRLIRHIELLTSPKKQLPINNYQITINDVLKIGLSTKREVLNRRIDERVIKRIDQGMIEEVKNLLDQKLDYQRLQDLGLEYRIISDYLTGRIETKDELIKQLQNKIHQYGKRQMTWFKNEKDVFWFDISDKEYERKVAGKVLAWYNTANG